MILSAAPRGITPDEFRDVSTLLHAITGIRLVAGKEALVMGRLDKRLRHLGVDTYREYLRLLRAPEHSDELATAIDLLTTNETYFFREEQHFDFLRRAVLPRFRHGRQFRLWSAASSSGEEAYTAAMVIAEELPEDAPWGIVGTDVSSRVVSSAQRGVYPLAAADRIPAHLLRRYWWKGRDEYDGTMAVGRQLRERVSFAQANLLEDLGRLGHFDVILLRNVMIYFDMETKAALVARLQEMLQPGGYLIVSLAETLNGFAGRLVPVEPSIYRLGAGVP